MSTKHCKNETIMQVKRKVRAHTKEMYAVGDGTYIEAVENNPNLVDYIGATDEVAFTAGSDHLDIGKPQWAVVP